MSWTIKRNAEQEKEERSNEKANGENDPHIGFPLFVPRQSEF